MPATILVVDDTETSRELANYLLEARGHRLLLAGSGEEALHWVGQEVPDLILLDLQMSDMDGYEVLKKLRERPDLSSVPVVAVTAFAMVGDRERAVAAGFDGYFTKPINAETFVDDLEGFLPAELRSQAGKPVWERNGARPSPDRVHRGSVLVVDNNQVNLSLFQGTLEPSGYAVLTATGGREALELVRRARPDLVLTDLNMPDGNGVELIRALKADPELRTIPIVMVSASSPSSEDEEAGLLLGAHSFVRRPVEPQSLLAAIDAAMRRGA